MSTVYISSPTRPQPRPRDKGAKANEAGAKIDAFNALTVFQLTCDELLAEYTSLDDVNTFDGLDMMTMGLLMPTVFDADWGWTIRWPTDPS